MEIEERIDHIKTRLDFIIRSKRYPKTIIEEIESNCYFAAVVSEDDRAFFNAVYRNINHPWDRRHHTKNTNLTPALNKSSPYNHTKCVELADLIDSLSVKDQHITKLVLMGVTQPEICRLMGLTFQELHNRLQVIRDVIK